LQKQAKAHKSTQKQKIWQKQAKAHKSRQKQAKAFNY